MKKGDLVWTKFDTYPHWPSRIASDEVTQKLREYKDVKSGVGVLFFGEELEYGLVELNCIEPFAENYDKHINAHTGTNKKNFEAALEQAKISNQIQDPVLELEDKKKNRRSMKNKGEDTKENKEVMDVKKSNETVHDKSHGDKTEANKEKEHKKSHGENEKKHEKSEQAMINKSDENHESSHKKVKKNTENFVQNKTEEIQEAMQNKDENNDLVNKEENKPQEKTASDPKIEEIKPDSSKNDVNFDTKSGSINKIKGTDVNETSKQEIDPDVEPTMEFNNETLPESNVSQPGDNQSDEVIKKFKSEGCAQDDSNNYIPGLNSDIINNGEKKAQILDQMKEELNTEIKNEVLNGIAANISDSPVYNNINEDLKEDLGEEIEKTGNETKGI